MLIRISRATGSSISIVFMPEHFTNFLGATQKEEATVLFTLFAPFQLFNAFNCRELDDTPMFKNLLNNKLMLGVFLIACWYCAAPDHSRWERLYLKRPHCLQQCGGRCC